MDLTRCKKLSLIAEMPLAVEPSPAKNSLWCSGQSRRMDYCRRPSGSCWTTPAESRRAAPRKIRSPMKRKLSHAILIPRRRTG